MDRTRQRHLSLLVSESNRAFALHWPTIDATIFASADEVEALIKAGEIEQLKDYTPTQRRRMAREGRAMPDGSFPIADCNDAANAIRSVGRTEAAKRSKVEAHIRRRVRTMGCSGSVYENWK